MNLFKLNAQIAVKLNQSLDTLYNMEYMEYSMLLNIINEETEEKNSEIEKSVNLNEPLKVNLPSHLKVK